MKATQHDLFARRDRTVLTAPDVDNMLAAGAPVAVGVSGGKDSQACAVAVTRYLDSIGHGGPRILVHSDLGRVEWDASLPTCQTLAENLGCELLTVRRSAGDLMDRWLGRWTNNVARYRTLECVKLILPWSTPSMRFCTSELKTAVIASALRKRWPTGPVISAVGIRAEESAARAKMPVSAAHAKLARANSAGLSWHPILDWTLPQVLAEVASAGLALHPAYTVHGASRVSCRFCIMSSAADLAAAARAEENVEIYREMVRLELDSTFAFQGSRWLCDVAPDLLDYSERTRIDSVKNTAERRVIAESRIPPKLLYVKGWPTFVPSISEAGLIAAVRRDVSALIGLDVDYTDSDSVRRRYQELFDERSAATAH